MINVLYSFERGSELEYNLLEGGTSNAWESFILGVDCVFIKGLSLTNSWLSAYQSLMK